MLTSNNLLSITMLYRDYFGSFLAFSDIQGIYLYILLYIYILYIYISLYIPHFIIVIHIQKYEQL